jgi:hypothetical protein
VRTLALPFGRRLFNHAAVLLGVFGLVELDFEVARRF